MQGPLAGFRVVEVAMWVAGPSAAAILADWGADVIKIENPRGGDPIRGLTAPARTDSQLAVAPGYELDNRNKRSVAVNLRRAQGRDFALRLIDTADVFVTNLRLDALEEMGLDYASLARRNPRLVHASLNAYGHHGPERLRPGFDYAAGWSRSGLMATVAEPDEPPPAQRPGMIDHAAGLGMAGAVSAALLARERSGRGCEVHLSLFSMGLWMNATDLTVGLMCGAPPKPESRNARPNPLWNSYQCQDGRWIYFVMLQDQRHWPEFCAALGCAQWLENPRFGDSEARRRNCRELISAIGAVVAARARSEWAPIFDRHGLFWAPVQTNEEVLEDPQARAIGAFAPVDHPRIADCYVVNGPVRFSLGGADPPYRAAPELGQHSEEVALELGLSWEEIARLKQSGALG